MQALGLVVQTPVTPPLSISCRSFSWGTPIQDVWLRRAWSFDWLDEGRPDSLDLNRRAA